MNKLFVPYPLAKLLKDKGFKEDCIATIDQTEYLHLNGTKWPGIRGAMLYDTIPCPLWQQVTKWLRDVHDIHIEIGTTLSEESKTDWILYRLEPINGKEAVWEDIMERFTTYERALEVGINEALKLI